MNHQISQQKPGLYLIATPIGNVRDITLRALDLLASVDIIASEDTRTTRRLMEIHGVPLGGRRMIAYHDHSPVRVREEILAHVTQGKSVGYVSEAGTPLISDPGYALAGSIAEAKQMVTSAPGACALIAALSIAGLPTDRFAFFGFAPRSPGARRSFLAEAMQTGLTAVFYESPSRVQDLLMDLALTSNDRTVVLCREITKKFEQIVSGTAQEILARREELVFKGEFVVLVEGRGQTKGEQHEIAAALKEAMKTMRIKDAATAVAGAFGAPRREVYQMALKLEDDDE